MHFGSYQFNDNSMLGFNGSAYLAGDTIILEHFQWQQNKNNHFVAKCGERQNTQTTLELQKKRSSAAGESCQRQLSEALLPWNNMSLLLNRLQKRYVFCKIATQGLVKTSDVLFAQTQLYQQSWTPLQSVFNYNTAVANLQFLTTNK